MDLFEQLRALLLRKTRADALAPEIREQYAAEYEQVRTALAETAVGIVDQVLTAASEIQRLAETAAETLATEDYSRLLELAGRIDDYVQIELAGWETVTGKHPF